MKQSIAKNYNSSLSLIESEEINFMDMINTVKSSVVVAYLICFGYFEYAYSGV